MGKCRSLGELRAFLDEELPPELTTGIRSHLEHCSSCQSQVLQLQVNRSLAEERLAGIALRLGEKMTDQSAAVSDTGQALAQLYKKAALRPKWKERLDTMFGTIRHRWQPILATVAVLVAVVLAFSLEPVRVAAEDFLSIFRVRQFAVIPIGPEQQEQMAEISALLEQNFFLGDPVMIEEQQTFTANSLDEAAMIAGFQPLAPGYLPDGFSLTGFDVSTRGIGQFEVDLELARSLFEMLELDPLLLPDSLGEEPLTVTMPPMVSQSWETSSESALTLVQGLSPTIDFPADVDPALLGEVALQLLGMSEQEAQRLSDSIDWTSTLVLPIPTDVASFSEVTINGNSGLLISRSPEAYGVFNAVMWQEDDVLYFLSGHASMEVMVSIADSVQ